MSANVVSFVNEMFTNTSFSDFHARFKWLAAFRDLDLHMKFDSLEHAYKRYSKRAYFLRNLRSLSSLKQLLLPVIVSLYNDNSVPITLKDTYFAALSTLRGLASLHLQIDNQAFHFGFDHANVMSLMPTKQEVSNWRRPTLVGRTFPLWFGSSSWRDNGPLMFFLFFLIFKRLLSCPHFLDRASTRWRLLAHPKLAKHPYLSTLKFAHLFLPFRFRFLPLTIPHVPDYSAEPDIEVARCLGACIPHLFVRMCLIPVWSAFIIICLVTCFTKR